MGGQNFPVDEYLRPQIRNARTISRSGQWWTAVLVIEDPVARKPFLALYKWQKQNDGWQKKSSFRINSAKHLATIVESLQAFPAEFQE